MRGRIVVLPQAISDIEDHHAYLVRESAAAASRFLYGVESTFGALAGMPGMGALYQWHSERLEGVRVFPVSGFQKYLIFYRAVSRGIEVIRVLHRSRDIESIFVEKGLVP